MKKFLSIFILFFSLGCSTDFDLTSILTDDDILYLSGYENVKIVRNGEIVTGDYAKINEKVSFMQHILISRNRFS